MLGRSPAPQCSTRSSTVGPPLPLLPPPRTAPADPSHAPRSLRLSASAAAALSALRRHSAPHAAPGPRERPRGVARPFLSPGRVESGRCRPAQMGDAWGVCSERRVGAEGAQGRPEGGGGRRRREEQEARRGRVRCDCWEEIPGVLASGLCVSFTESGLPAKSRRKRRRCILRGAPPGCREPTNSPLSCSCVRPSSSSPPPSR